MSAFSDDSSAVTVPPRYSVIVPVFNEAQIIGEFCRQVRAALPPDYELLVCYDQDHDTTLPAIAALSADEKPQRLRLIKNDLGPGVRYAIEAGMRAAQSPVVIVTMADLSDDYSCIETMLERIESGADVVCPSRYMRGGKQIGGPWLKKFLSRAAGVSLYWLTGLPTHDPTNSFKAYRKSFLDQQPIESTAGFCLGMELTVKAHSLGGKVEELPATWLDRTAGESRFRLWKWLPMYLHWYSWAFDRSRRADRLAVLMVLAIAAFLALANIALRPDLSYGQAWIMGEPGNPLYRAERLNQGAMLYRDVACQYGAIPVYVYAMISRIAGNTINYNLAWQLCTSLICLFLIYRLLRRSLSVALSSAITVVAALPMVSPVGIIGSGTGVEYPMLERICFLAIMLLWRQPEMRLPRHSIGIGLLLGLWQGIKFGGALFALPALFALDVAATWSLQNPDWAQVRRSWLTILGVFLAVEAAWMALAYATLPPLLARDTIWPAYMRDGYPMMSDKKRLPGWSGLGFFFGQQLLPLTCAVIALVTIVHFGILAAQSRCQVD